MMGIAGVKKNVEGKNRWYQYTNIMREQIEYFFGIKKTALKTNLLINERILYSIEEE